MDRSAPVAHPVTGLVRKRWSPRAFSDRAIDDATLASLFEAARWAPSSYNEQPWRFIVATRAQPEAFQRLLGCLIPTNQAWAAAAPVLGMTVAVLAQRDGKENPYARHDCGAALVSLSLEAAARDIFVHQMGGFDAARAISELGIPGGHLPGPAFALGQLGDPASLPPGLREREVAPRARKPLAELVWSGRFGERAGWAG